MGATDGDDTTDVDQEVTVAIPTVGRMAMLSACIDALRSGTVHPGEVLLLDQSGSGDVGRLVRSETVLNLRHEVCDGRGIARNMNLALRKSATEAMLVTHDDCVVAPDWVERGAAALRAVPGGIVTGRVLGGGADPDVVPSTIGWDEAYDFTGTLAHGALYPNNMGLHRTTALDIGGFDEREGFATAAEDLDFSYRWLRSGGQLRYEPQMTVTHNDWRSPEVLVRLHRHYARCAGRFYGKHLAHGDRHIARQMFADLKLGVKAWRCRLRSGDPVWRDERLQLPLWVPIGAVEGVIDELVSLRPASSGLRLVDRYRPNRPGKTNPGGIRTSNERWDARTPDE